MPVPYEKADVRRRQLVGGARSVLGREGMNGATLRAVAAEVGVPLGTVHYIFKTKEQLLRAVLEGVILQIADVAGSSGAADASFTDRMLGSAFDFWDQLVEQDIGSQIMQYELTMWALRTKGMDDVARSQYQAYIDTVAVRWTRAAEDASVELAVPADQLSRLLLGGVDGLIIQYLTLRDAERSRSDLDVLVRQLIELAQHGPPSGP